MRKYYFSKDNGFFYDKNIFDMLDTSLIKCKFVVVSVSLLFPHYLCTVPSLTIHKGKAVSEI